MATEKKVSVGMIVHNPPFQGGVVQFCVLLANSLGDKVSLSAFGYRSPYPKFLYKGVLPSVNGSSINFSCPVENLLKWYSPLSWYRTFRGVVKNDVIHIQWLTAFLGPIYFFITLLNALSGGKKVVLTCHNITDHEKIPFAPFFTRAVFKRTDAFVVHAEENRERLNRFYGVPYEKVTVIPHGNFSFFTEQGKKLAKTPKEELGLSNGDKVVLFFGYIRKYKGVAYLIRAMKKVVETRPDARLVIAGECWEEWDEHRREIEKLGLSPFVKADIGYVDDRDVATYFNAADLVVLPYFNGEQTISGPLLVSFAFGKPTIAGKCGGIANMVRDGVDGILVEPGDIEGYAEQITRLLGDPSGASAIGSQALNSIKNHEWRTVAEHYVALYRKVSGI